MDAKKKQQFKDLITKELAELREEIPRLKERMQPVSPDESIGRLSRMDNIVNQSVVEAQLSKARVRILKLEEALKRLEDDPDFGLCEECGDPIPLARLRAMPEAVLCVECAE